MSNDKKQLERSLDAAWEGVMVTYIERDSPFDEGYERQVPGWKCRACGQQYGTSRLPPKQCKCGATWAKEPT